MTAENQQKSSVYFSVLCGHEREGWINPTLANFLALTLQKGTADRSIVTIAASANPVAISRNRIVAQFLESSCDWLCMSDNDMRPCPNLFEILNNAPAEASVIVPRMHSYVDALQLPMLSWKPIAHPGLTGWQELSICATSVIFIKRDVFDRIGQPWFEFGMSPDGLTAIGEDFIFCKKIRAANLKIFGNRNFSVGHIKSLNLETIAARAPEIDMNFGSVRPVQANLKAVETGIVG